MALTRMLNKLNSKFEDNLDDFFEDLGDQDEDDEGTVPFEMVEKSTKMLMIQLDD